MLLDTAPAPAIHNCVWMNAGLLSYRLCDRGFDCEHCLLDAAMRGEFFERARDAADPVGATLWAVPDDRLYSPGHAWLQAHAADARVWRLGIDAFAAAIIGRAAGVRSTDAGVELRPGEPAFEIDAGIGTLQFAAPASGRVVRRNPMLREQPGRLVTDPYDSGWILELDLSDLSGLLGMLSPAAARQRLATDWSHFRRSVAFHLLASGNPGCGLLQIGQPVTDVRVILGAPDYLQLLREFVH